MTVTKNACWCAALEHEVLPCNAVVCQPPCQPTTTDTPPLLLGSPAMAHPIEPQLLSSAAPPTVLQMQHIDDSNTESMLVRTSRRTSTTLRWTLEVLPCNMLASAHLLAAQKVTMDAMQCAPPCQPTAWWVTHRQAAMQHILCWAPTSQAAMQHILCWAPTSQAAMQHILCCSTNITGVGPQSPTALQPQPGQLPRPTRIHMAKGYQT
jgi:hypothetical protein